MTAKYQFTDKSIKLSQDLVSGLYIYIFTKNHECKNSHNSERITHLLISLEAAFLLIQEYRQNDLEQSLDDILEREYLTFTEALFILYGLYPSHCFDLRQIRELDDMDGYNHTFLLSYFETNSKVYAKLSSAITAGKESTKHGIQSDSKGGVYTEQFIPWAIDKKFIEKTVKDQTGNKTTGKVDSEKRNYPEEFAKELHKQLTDQGLISGGLNEMWLWLPIQSALVNLADKLSIKFSDECPSSRKGVYLLAYIEKSGKTPFNKLIASNNSPILRKIDNAISGLKDNYTK